MSQKFVDVTFEKDHYLDGLLVKQGAVKSVPESVADQLFTPIEYTDDDGKAQKLVIAKPYVKASAPAAPKPKNV